jgi:hypothetical protein
MRIALFSIAYLPPLDYIKALYSYEKIIIETMESYPRQTWRNRCRIATANGPIFLSIPVEKPNEGPFTTNRVTISRKHSWQRNHWKAIQSAYCRSPFFIYYRDLIEPFYNVPHPDNLITWNTMLLEAVCSQIKSLPEIVYSEAYIKNPQGMEDLREAFSPKTHKQKTIISADLPEYWQVFNEKLGFIPNLSIIDALFNLGPDVNLKGF